MILGVHIQEVHNLPLHVSWPAEVERSAGHVSLIAVRAHFDNQYRADE